jgi:hypothetical protein
MNIINNINFKNLHQNYLSATPYNHIVIDNFFTNDFALKLEEEFPNFNDEKIAKISLIKFNN